MRDDGEIPTTFDFGERREVGRSSIDGGRVVIRGGGRASSVDDG